MNQQAKTYYQSTIASTSLLLKKEKKISLAWSLARAICFIALLISAYFLIKMDATTPALLSILGLIIVLFFWLVNRQFAVDERVKLYEKRIHLLTNELTVLENGPNLYYCGIDYIDPKHPYTSDLDMFGTNSLYHRYNRTNTFEGSRLLQKWFSTIPNEKAGIKKRQTAAMELEGMHTFRMALQEGLYDYIDQSQIDVFATLRQLMNVDLSSMTSTWLRWYTKLVPLIWVLLLTLYLLGEKLAGNMAIGLFIINLLLVGQYSKKINRIQAILTKVSATLKGYLQTTKTINDVDFKNSYLRSCASIFHQSTAIKDIHTISNKLDYRLNLLAGPMLNGLLLWDLRMVHQMATWNSSSLDEIKLLFTNLGEIEALASIATWSYHHQDYSYADFRDEVALEIKGAIHPLMPIGSCVANDFLISPSDHLSIITGSNMSGKSTFLRTLGANMVLAYLGGRVCATHLTLPIVLPYTYMRIKDSLEENVSTFKAEINRLKAMLDVVRSKTPSLLLIDEMLRGTNSIDKLNGSLGISREIIDLGAYAIVATHDIKLTSLANQYPRKIKNYFFDITIDGDDLSFDYKIKDGICNTFNAVHLLRQIGVEV